MNNSINLSTLVWNRAESAVNCLYLTEAFYNSASGQSCLSLFPVVEDRGGQDDGIGGDFITVVHLHTYHIPSHH